MRTLLKSIVFGFCTLFGVLATAQTTPDAITFQVAPRLPTSPIYISSIQINGLSVPLNQNVILTPDWAQHLTVIVTNASQKTVVTGHVEMYFPQSGEQTSNNLVVARTLQVGRPPAVAMYKKDGTPRTVSSDVTSAAPISMAPGQSVTLNFSQVAPNALTEAIAKTGTVTNVAFALGMFYFDDNSRWFPGRFSVPGSSPGVWKEISANDFYLGSH